MNTLYRYPMWKIVGKLTGFFLLILLVLPAQAQQERKHIRSGNHLYNEALLDSGRVDSVKMELAEQKYRKATEKKSDSFAAGFNLGNALFKQKKYEDAIGQYQLLTNKTDDKKELGQLYYNLGNAWLAKGNLKKSLESYKNSLRANPNDTAAKYNLAVVQKMLNDPQQQQQQQQQDQEQNQDQEQQEQQQQDQKQQQDQQQQQDQGKEGQQDKQEQQEGQQGQEQSNEDKQEGKEGKAVKEDQISKEDAERVLQLLQMQEQKVIQKLQDQKSNQKRRKIDKDW